MLLALLRLVRWDPGSVVLIDGVSIAALPLRVLRGAIAVIPQDPLLFSGTVRFNLDPTHSHSDEVCVCVCVCVCVHAQLMHRYGCRHSAQCLRAVICRLRALHLTRYWKRAGRIGVWVNDNYFALVELCCMKQKLYVLTKPLRRYVCMCVCVCVCMYDMLASVCACLRAVYGCMHLCMFVHVCMHGCMYIRECILVVTVDVFDYCQNGIFFVRSHKVDARTDELMQDILSTQFQHATVLVIAHRLSTISAVDRVISVEVGQRAP